MLIAWNLIAIVALGMAVAATVADHRSANTRMLALMLTCLALTFILDANFIAARPPNALPAWAPWAVMPGALAIIALAEWLRGIRQTGQPLEPGMHSGLALRLIQFFALLYAVLGLLFPDWRAAYLLHSFEQPQLFSQPPFYLFALPLLACGLLLLLEVFRTFLWQPDPPERLRLLGIGCALPLIALGLILPAELGPYSSIMGEMLLLIAIMQYHVQWGRRGHFMSRFMSPQVASAVRARGLDETMHDQRLELTTVSCDIRGFTAYADTHGSQATIALLQAYYEKVGEAAAKHGATLKDYAGDGILLLMGAPLPDPNHAEGAINLAIDIQHLCRDLWRDTHPALGLGIGIASGEVNVGIVGVQPLEYVAVGSSVNLAARLCGLASDGEILVGPRSHELLVAAASSISLQPAGSVNLKGVSAPVSIWRTAHPYTLPQRPSRSWLRRLLFAPLGG